MCPACGASHLSGSVAEEASVALAAVFAFIFCACFYAILTARTLPGALRAAKARRGTVRALRTKRARGYRTHSGRVLVSQGSADRTLTRGGAQGNVIVSRVREESSHCPKVHFLLP